MLSIYCALSRHFTARKALNTDCAVCNAFEKMLCSTPSIKTKGAMRSKSRKGFHVFNLLKRNSSVWETLGCAKFLKMENSGERFVNRTVSVTYPS